MYLSTNKKTAGWTLIELLLVLICVAALTSILVYAFAGRVQQQDNTTMIVSNVDDLVAGAHNWRLNQSHSKFTGGVVTGTPSYVGLPTISQLSTYGYLAPSWVSHRKKWLRNGSSTYSISQVNYARPRIHCNTKNSCFMITIKNLKNPCYAVVAIAATIPNSIKPSVKRCQHKPDNTSKNIRVYYD